jgi:hypothetical protein
MFTKPILDADDNVIATITGFANVGMKFCFTVKSPDGTILFEQMDMPKEMFFDGNTQKAIVNKLMKAYDLNDEDRIAIVLTLGYFFNAFEVSLRPETHEELAESTGNFEIITPVESLAMTIQEKVRDVTYQQSQKNLPDTSIRVGNVTSGFIKDIDKLANVKSRTKSASALFAAGALKCKDILKDAERDAIIEKSREHGRRATQAKFRKIGIEQYVRESTELSMPATYFNDAMSVLRSTPRAEVVHCYPIPYVTSTLDYLDDLGFKHGAGYDFLAMLAIQGTDYARELGIESDVDAIIEITVNSLKRLSGSQSS